MMWAVIVRSDAPGGHFRFIAARPEGDFHGYAKRHPWKPFARAARAFSVCLRRIVECLGAVTRRRPRRLLFLKSCCLQLRQKSGSSLSQCFEVLSQIVAHDGQHIERGFGNVRKAFGELQNVKR